MKKVWLVAGVVCGYMAQGLAQAAPGEWWELSAKAEMPGMPFAMPAQTNKFCMPKGGEADPRQTQGKDSNCKISDMQHSGNTVKFKGVCVNDGEAMNMVGEMTHDGNSFKSIMKMTGKSQGEPINMTMTSNGKRIGGACDTEELNKKVQAQVRQIEETQAEQKAAVCKKSDSFDTSEWVSHAAMFVGGSQAMCPDKKAKFCSVVRNDVPKDFKAFNLLIEQDNGGQISKECNVNLTAMAKSQCKARARKGPQAFLDKYCPAEAKSYRELMRKMDACAQRGYTAGDKLKKCMNGPIPEDDEDSASGDASDSSNSGVNTDSVLQGAKKLKGLFGF